ncbi:hypothetical protein BDP27DRAFT_1230380 [Rhodocollybia butyracea]|uniref:hAT-like transposase RNase-H fold domain-containing protein n=1 Tax=Rhodocollybia butyracea TaxID=206335 RepID=A0A9P5PJH3_9AGAR|nr:hypothetical protein BDP27DRAFT_1230380 [Rhodocollybia butyracea]
MLATFLEMKGPISEFLDRSSNGMSEYVLEEEEWDVIEGLVSALKDATLFFSSNTPNVASVIPAMDAIDKALATGIINNEVLSEPIQHALAIGKKTLNKYYALTDDSVIYCMAMVLHPLLRLEYFCKAGWNDKWIADAVTVIRQHWEKHYKPLEPTPSDIPMVCFSHFSLLS